MSATRIAPGGFFADADFDFDFEARIALSSWPGSRAERTEEGNEADRPQHGHRDQNGRPGSDRDPPTARELDLTRGPVGA
jgi:hypothetical protein